MKTCVLLSGGMDSIAVCYWKRPDLAITLDYGQAPAEAEVSSAASVANALDIPHLVVRANCSETGLGDLLPLKRDLKDLPVGIDVPSSDWWPYRNQLIVTLAAAACVVRGVSHLVIGTVSTDTLHKDGSPEFYSTLNSLLALQEGGLSISAPAAKMTTLELIRTSGTPISLLGWSHSCHRGNWPCGYCRGCLKFRHIWAALI